MKSARLMVLFPTAASSLCGGGGTVGLATTVWFIQFVRTRRVLGFSRHDSNLRKASVNYAQIVSSDPICHMVFHSDAVVFDNK